jgi:hypothetical protein
VIKSALVIVRALFCFCFTWWWGDYILYGSFSIIHHPSLPYPSCVVCCRVIVWCVYELSLMLGAELSAALGHCASRSRFCGRQKSVKSAERECIFNYPIFRALGLSCALLYDRRDDMMDECNAERWTMVS